MPRGRKKVKKIVPKKSIVNDVPAVEDDEIVELSVEEVVVPDTEKIEPRESSVREG